MERERIKKMISLMLILALCSSSVTMAFAERQTIIIKGKPLKGFDKTCVGSATGMTYTTSTDKLYVDGEVAFCIQSGYKIQGFDPSGEDEAELIYDASEIVENDSLQNKIAYLGWHDSSKTDKDYAFTQMYIWQSLPDVPASGNATIKFVSTDLNNEYREWKKEIDRRISNWKTKPSFDYGTGKKAIDIAAGETKTVTDSNGVLEDYKAFSYTDSGITVSHKAGANTLTVKASENCSIESVSMNSDSLQKAGCCKYDKSAAASYIYEHEKSQNIATYAPGFIEPISMELKFDVKTVTGKIAIEKTKSPDAASDQTMPEAGAEFQVYLKTAGSYAASPADYRDIITTGKDGKAVTRDLPHGTYIVRQTKGAGDHKFIEDFEVTIGTDSHDKVYTYKINNETLQSKIKIVKKDAETGKTIPLAGTKFELTNLTTGEQIKSGFEDGCFETDKKGEIALPFPLYYGSYRLTERKAPEGYVLAGPIEFTVDGRQETLEIEVKDMPQKGIIKLHKTGEILQSVKENEDGTYTPVFGSADMEGAEFEVSAAEDIITPEGTVRVRKGEVVGNLVTDSEGNAQTGIQYLGKFNIVETKAPYGHILDDTVYTVELKYAGQEAEITDTSIDFDNDRQKAKIRLTKAIEEDELFGMYSDEAYKDIRFGLFAAEEITAADGSTIPESGLIEVIGVQPLRGSDDGENRGEAIAGEAPGADEEPGTEAGSSEPEESKEPEESEESEESEENTAQYTEYTGEFETDIPFARLYVKELAANGQYVINDTEYPIEFSYQGRDMAIIDIDVNDGEAIENDLIRGKIIGLKTGDKDKPLGGAVFGLFKQDEEEFTAENALKLTETDEKGYFEFSDIPKGSWLIREIASPRGYLLSDEIHEVLIEEDGQIIEIEAANAPKIGYVRFLHDIEMTEEELCMPVKTGDEIKIPLWLALIIISASGAITAAWRMGFFSSKRRKDKK